MVDAVGATSYAYGSAGTFLTEDGPWADDAMTIANNQLTAGSRSGTLTVAGTAASATQATDNGQGAYLYSDKTWAVTGVPLATTSLTDGAGHAATHTITLNPATVLSPQYDPNGNLLSDGRRSFTYDTENQLVSVLVTNGPLDATLSGFVYDGLSRRRLRTEAVWRPTGWVTNEVVRYLYDGNRVIQERDGNNTVLVTYTCGLDLSGSLEGAGGIGGLLARTHPGNHHFYYHSDANGNVTAIINQSTNLVAQYRYDPFGNLVAQSGPLGEGNLYRFSSKEFHQASGLYYYGYRFYDPNLQRWLNKDPIGEGGGVNLHGFVCNDPANQNDPMGLVLKMCGPDVTDAIHNTMQNLQSTWDSWSESEQYDACHDLRRYVGTWMMSGVADLGYATNSANAHEILRNSFGTTAYGSVGSETSLTYDGKCYSASGLQYIMWGFINSKCHYSLGSTKWWAEKYKNWNGEGGYFQGTPETLESYKQEALAFTELGYGYDVNNPGQGPDPIVYRNNPMRASTVSAGVTQFTTYWYPNSYPAGMKKPLTILQYVIKNPPKRP